MNITVTKNPNPGKLPPADQLGFGSVFTDHMFLMDYTDQNGWHNARIVPFGPISMSPAASVLHYGTEVFEGLKAYRRPDGGVQLFRPWENVARLNRSCDRLGLPRIDEDDGLQAIRELVKVDSSWVPSDPGTSLYIRPFLYSTDPTLALHGVHEATFAIILSPSGSYFKNGLQPVPIMVETRMSAPCAAAPARPSAAATTPQPTAQAIRPSKKATRRSSGSTASSANTSKRAAA